MQNDVPTQEQTMIDWSFTLKKGFNYLKYDRNLKQTRILYTKQKYVK